MATCWQERATLTRGTARLVVGACVVLGLVMATPRARAQEPPVEPQAGALPFRAEPPLRSYVAIRRLESENERHGKEAFLVARTELREDGTFRYEVLEEGGSEFIRRKVLHESLEKEVVVHREGRAGRSGFTHANYQFAPPTSADGLVRVGLVPRRREDLLVKGALFTSTDGEILRLEGELVKRPSFWTKSVRLVRQYDRVDGMHVPVRLDMVAQVRLAGTSTLTVTYDYLEINGRPVGERAAHLTRAMSSSRAAPQR